MTSSLNINIKMNLHEHTQDGDEEEEWLTFSESKYFSLTKNLRP